MADLIPTPSSGNIIGGDIPFGPGGNPIGGYVSGGLGGLADQYQQSYNNALAQNHAMYGNIMGGYQQTAAQAAQASQAIAGGYNNLYNQVLGGIQGIGASQAQAINDQYAQMQGQTDQGLIDRGLGNSTVANALARGNMLDKQKAQIALANQLAATQAGYQSQLGLAGLNYANEANLQGLGLAGSQLGFMNSVTAKYPNQGDYYSIFDAAGKQRQAEADRQAIQQSRRTGFGMGGGGIGGSVQSSGPGGGFGKAMLPSSTMGPSVYDPYGGGGGGGGGFQAGAGGPTFSTAQQARDYLASLNDPYSLSQAGTMYLNQQTEEPPLANPYYDAQGYNPETGMADLGNGQSMDWFGDTYDPYGNYDWADTGGYDNYDMGTVDATDTGYYDQWF